MRRGILLSVAHNIADSLACGNGSLIGVYQIDVYAKVERSPSGGVTIDFLRGVVSEGDLTGELQQVVSLYRDALPVLCVKHGVSVQDFAELTVRYSLVHSQRRFVVSVMDQRGRRSAAEYGGIDSHRMKIIDSEGRVSHNHD